MPISKLLEIYVPLVGWTGFGWLIGHWLPTWFADRVGNFLFWVGVPIGIVAFLRQAQVSWSLWLAPVIAWCALLSGLGLARLYLHYRGYPWSRKTHTSFMLTSMVGNTGYIGFPVALVLVGPQYFAWAVFYDLLGSTPGAYGLGVALGAQAQAAELGNFTTQSQASWRSLLKTMAINPALWSFAIGLAGRNIPLPSWLEISLRVVAWSVISVALVLIGIRLSQVRSLKNGRLAIVSLAIKMLIVPLLIGLVLQLFRITGTLHQVLLLQMAMPPAFATLVISEAYDLDRQITVTTMAIGSLLLLVTLPLWLWIFP